MGNDVAVMNTENGNLFTGKILDQLLSDLTVDKLEIDTRSSAEFILYEGGVYFLVVGERQTEGCRSI